MHTVTQPVDTCPATNPVGLVKVVAFGLSPGLFSVCRRQMCGRRFAAGQRQGQEDAQTADDLLESAVAAAEQTIPTDAVPGAT